MKILNEEYFRQIKYYSVTKKMDTEFFYQQFYVRQRLDGSLKNVIPKIVCLTS